MNDIAAVFKSAKEILPPEVYDDFVQQLGISDDTEASPAGAVLMGMYILDYLGFSRYIDDLLGVEHTSIEYLKEQYKVRLLLKKPTKPSYGTILSLLVADMIAYPRRITPAYKFEEMAKIWHTGPLLGIEPSLLNDDRIGRAISALGLKKENMEEILYTLVMGTAKKAGIPLDKFLLDTTLLQLDGKFKDADKVVPGRGKNSFAQLVIGLVVASGSRLPVGFAVLAGNTNDAKTLPEAFETIHRIADEGPVELIFDRIFPTPSNILYLKDQESRRENYWISPLKTGLSQKRVRQEIDTAYAKNKWKPISYRSTKEIIANIKPPLSAYETSWTLTETIKPELEPGQKRRPKGSIITREIEVRCVFYRNEIQAVRDREKREAQKEALEGKLQDFAARLNKGKYAELEHCREKLNKLLKESSMQLFVNCQLSSSEQGLLTISWSFNEQALAQELKYDGIFALLTNYSRKKVRANNLITKYRNRNEVEIDIKQLRGLLDLERILFQKPERIDCYVFLKIMALFALTFMRVYTKKAGVKATERDIQESMGNMLLIESTILPVDMKKYSVARDTDLNRLFRQTFSLPEPRKLIMVLNAAEIAKSDEYVQKWYEAWLQEQLAPQ